MATPGLGQKMEAIKKASKDVGGSHVGITTDYGVKLSNTDDWLKVSTEDRTGPSLLEDHAAREKINRFDHERIPERVVHARGAGAFGTFKMHKSLEQYTTAKVLTETSRITPVFQRFSTVLGSRGSADTVRDVRGFAIKFYTPEGNWDIVGNNMPVFFYSGCHQIPRSYSRWEAGAPQRGASSTERSQQLWDFQSLHTEATHMFMWQQSDRAIPRSYRMMEGFGVNTFKFVNAKEESFLVKFHFRPQLGVHSLVWDEALKLAGQDPDFHRKDLMEAINNGVFPKWDFGVQIIPEEEQDNFKFDPLDATKIWPFEEVPIEFVGELELNRNVDEYFTQTEQVAFCTGHLVPGIHHSDDPLLQGRSFSYMDTQISRLGTNWQELPINKPICPVMNHNRDGQLRHTITKGTVNYWPNRFSAVPPSKPEEAYVEAAEKVSGMKQRLRSKKFSDHFSQAQLFYNSMSDPEKAHIQAALGFELDHCDDAIVYQCMSQRLADVDLDLARVVAELVGGDVPVQEGQRNHGRTSQQLSQTELIPKEPTIASRRVAILIADGFDLLSFDGIKECLKAAQAFPYVIGPKRSTIYPADTGKGSNEGVKPDHHIEGMRSTMFDSIFVPGGAGSIDTLRQTGRALHWVREAFAHLKAIGATGEAVSFVRDACSLPRLQFSEASDVVDSYGVVTLSKVEKGGFGETARMEPGATNFLDAYMWNISRHKNFAREMAGLPQMLAY